MAKIVFVYLEEPYFIYHSIGLAIEFAKKKENEVSILYNSRNEGGIQSLLPKNHFIQLIRVTPPWITELPLYIEMKLNYRKWIFKKYKGVLERQDVFISSLYNDLIIREIIAPKKISMVYTAHGPANGPYCFNNLVKQFDYFFCASKKEADIRREMGQIKANNYCIGGYLKLDAAQPKKLNIFNDDKNTVLYNPHWDKGLSSFFKYGFEILDFFKDHPNMNLIFAPHALLTKRNFMLRRRLKTYEKCTNIHMDYGSNYSHDFSYVKVADIYLGDVSSQALEFCLFEPRKCIFIDVKQNTGNHYISWGLGDVHSNSFNIANALSQIDASYDDHYKVKQKRIIDEVFTIPKEKTSTEKFAEELSLFIRSKS